MTKVMNQERREIEKLVYDKYPKSSKEFSCWQEKLRLQELRQEYRRRLESEYEKAKISGITFKQDELL